MSYSSQYGLTFVRTEANLMLPYWNNPNGPTWIRRMLPNGGNKNRGNVGINGKKWWANRISKIISNTTQNTTQNLSDSDIIATFQGTSGTTYGIYNHDPETHNYTTEINEILSKGYYFPANFYTGVTSTASTVDGINILTIGNIAVLHGHGPGSPSTTLILLFIINPDDNSQAKFIYNNSEGTWLPMGPVVPVNPTETEAESNDKVYYLIKL